MSLNRIFLTFFGLGLSPKAPGTVGSLGALIVAILLLRVIPMESLFMLTVAVSIIGIFEVDRYERESQTHDDRV